MARKPPAPATRSSLRATHRRRKQEHYIRLGLICLGVAVLITLGIGIYQVVIAEPNEPVAVVNGRKITTREYQAMVRYNRLNLRSQMESLKRQRARLNSDDENADLIRQIIDGQLQQLESAALSLPLQTLENMIDNELIRQEAEKRGLTASWLEVEEEAEAFFGYGLPTPTPQPDTSPTPAPTASPTSTAEDDATPEPTPTPQPTPTRMTLEDYKRLRSEYLKYVSAEAGFSEDMFLKLMEARVLARKLQEALAEEVPTTAAQVHVRQILVSSEEDATEIIQRLENGEDFAALAQEVSEEPSGQQGGDIGWLSEWSTAVPRSVYTQAIEMEPGERTIVVSSLGHHVIEVLEKDPNRPLSEDELEIRKSRALDNWLQEARQSDSVKRYWSSDKVPPQTPSVTR